MIAWRTLACSAAVLGLALTGCGDDADVTTGLSGLSGGGGTDSASSGSGGSGGSTGAPGTSDPTTGNPDATTTNDTNGPTTNNTTTPQTTSGDLTTGGPDTTTTNATNNSTDPGGCGNGAIDPNEQCDGANLNGFTCQSLGNAGGTLGCDPVTCTFDTSMCMGNGSGGTSG